MRKGLITICARGGSKGVPGKNIKNVGGNPLIYYSLKTAVACKSSLDVDIYLSTDSTDIRNVVNKLGLGSVNTDYERPEKLSTDTAGKLDVIKDIKDYAEKNNGYDYDYVIDLDVTSPFRTVEDLNASLNMLSNNEKAVNIFSVSPANRNPYFNMVEGTESGFYELCKKGMFLTRQSAPRVFDMNASFYIFKKEFFIGDYTTVITPYSLAYVVPHTCFDLDHAIDFEFMDYLITNDRLDFNFIK